MNYCLRNRVSPNFLSLVAEIKMDYRDIDSLSDLIDNYTQANIVIQIYQDTESINWSLLSAANKTLQEQSRKLYLSLPSVDYIKYCGEFKIPYFLGYGLSSFYELQNALSLGVSYVKLDAPLFFYRDKVLVLCDTTKTRIRAVANISTYNPSITINPKCGIYISPNDIDLYERYIDIIEFENVVVSQEEAFARAFAQKQRLISIPQYKYPILRLNCGQRCQMDPEACAMCEKPVEE